MLQFRCKPDREGESVTQAHSNKPQHKHKISEIDRLNFCEQKEQSVFELDVTVMSKKVKMKYHTRKHSVGSMHQVKM